MNKNLTFGLFMDFLALPQFLLLFPMGLGKPLSKASSGQALGERGNQLSSARRFLPALETDLLDPEAVLANEAFPKGSPRPDFFGTLNRPRHRQAGWKNFRADTFDAVPAHKS